MSSASAMKLRAPTDLFLKRLNCLMNTLARDYQRMRPQFGSDGFRERVFVKLSAYSLVLPNSIVRVDGKLDAQSLDKFYIEQEVIPSECDLWLIYSACAFGVAAKSALDMDERDRAWDLLAEGYFYLGVSNFGMSNWARRGGEMTDLAFKQYLDTEFARKGGAGRHKRTNEMKARAYELIRREKQERPEQDKGWPSQARAVAWLEIELKKEFGEYALRNFPDTIKRWLDTMEGREQHFPTVGANRARAVKVSP